MTTPLTPDYASPTPARSAADFSRLARVAVDLGARVLALAIVFGVFGILIGPAFFSAGNVENILMQSAVYTMAGLGMTMVIITGGIDLAAGSMIALAMVVTGLILRSGGENAYGFTWTVLAIVGGTAAAAVIGWSKGC